jgi:hypothetical protein
MSLLFVFMLYVATNSLSSHFQTDIIMKNAVFWDVTLCEFVIIDVSEESSASIIRVTRISVLGKR